MHVDRHVHTPGGMQPLGVRVGLLLCLQKQKVLVDVAVDNARVRVGIAVPTSLVEIGRVGEDLYACVAMHV